MQLTKGKKVRIIRSSHLYGEFEFGDIATFEKHGTECGVFIVDRTGKHASLYSGEYSDFMDWNEIKSKWENNMLGASSMKEEIFNWFKEQVSKYVPC